MRSLLRRDDPREPAGRAPPGLRGLLFDKDGTLFDFQATWGRWCDRLLRRLADGDRATAARLADAMHFDLERGRFHKSSPIIAGTVDDTVAAVSRAMPGLDNRGLRRLLVASAGRTELVPVTALAPLMARLADAGLALGLASNDAEAASRTHLAAVGVLDRFAFVAGYDSGFGAKPGTGMLEAFCRAAGLAPGEVAMIGDSTHDLHAARAAGMVPVGVLTGPAEQADLAPHADAVLDDIGGLPAWLGLPAAGPDAQPPREAPAT